MAVSSTQLLRVIQQFRRYYDRHFSELLSRTGLSMREMHVVLFLANHPAHDTARDVTELRGLAKSQVSAAVDLLAGIPSVVYGLVGMMVLVPLMMQVFHLDNGTCLLAAMLVLAIMILPGIVSVSETALNAVPPEYEHASLALGATWMETIFKVSLPAAKSGIGAGVVLGVGRAIGEAMAVMMVAGNVPNMPGLFKSVTFLTTAVAKEMSYASGLQRQALFSIALVLFIFIMLVNGLLGRMLKRGEKE